MKISELLPMWEGDASQPLTADEYRVRLPLYEAAKIAALAELFPGRSPEHLITDLLGAALDELQAGFPYVKGGRIVAHDEEGDPIFEDSGITPRFDELTRKHVARLQLRLKEKRAPRRKPAGGKKRR